MTLSNTARDTPIINGTVLSSSPHLCVKEVLVPSGFVALITPSNCLKVAVVFFWVSCMERTTTMRWAP